MSHKRSNETTTDSPKLKIAKSTYISNEENCEENYEFPKSPRRNRDFPDLLSNYDDKEREQYQKDLVEGRYSKWLDTPLDDKFIKIIFCRVKAQQCDTFLVPKKEITEEMEEILKGASEKGQESVLWSQAKRLTASNREIVTAMCKRSWTIGDLDPVLVALVLAGEGDIPEGKQDIYEERAEDYEFMEYLGDKYNLIGIWNKWELGSLFRVSFHLGEESVVKTCMIYEE